MNLRFTQTTEQRKAVICWPGALASLLLLGPWGATASAQDMSFDLDESETAPPAESEPAEADAEAGASLDAGGDVFSELTTEIGDEVGGADSNLPREREAAEEIYAVQRMYVIRDGRFELAPSLAFTVNDQFVSHPAFGVGLNYWVTNVLAVGANFLWYQGIESESDLNFSIRRSARLAVPITEYQLGAHLNFTYVPIYGKFTMFNDAIFQWDSYLVGGVGMVRTRPVAVVDPAVRSFDFDWRIAFNAGIGIRVFLTRYLTIFGELRDYIYLEKLENLEVALGDAREEENTWIDEEATLTNNVTVQMGVTLFFPFTFDYRYPK